MRFLFLTVLITALSQQAYSQKFVKYFKEDGQSVAVKDSADYIREIFAVDTNRFDLKEYYQSGKLKREGTVTKHEPFLKFEGLVKTYYKNGNKEEELFYKNDTLIGESKRYYKNGSLKEIIEYLHVNLEERHKMLSAPEKVICYFDSTGVQHIKDGNGFYYFSDSSKIVKGKYLNGFKDSIWIGNYFSKDMTYKEKYENGIFISGHVENKKTGKVDTYVEVESQPNYPGGIDEFRNFLGKNYRYPSQALKQKASGRVIVTFVVEKNGELSDIRILKDIGFGTGEEALRVIGLSKRWIPGKIHGMPVRVSYTIPFALMPPL